MSNIPSLPQPRTPWWRDRGFRAFMRETRHEILAQWGYDCAFCARFNVRRLQPRRIVPKSYFGPYQLWNLWPLCPRCSRRRHEMKGTSPQPERLEDIKRVLSTPLRLDVLKIFKTAAEYALEDEYDSRDASKAIAGRVSCLVGFMREDPPRSEDITPDSWAWLGSSAAWDAVFQNACRLLPAEGQAAGWTRCPRRTKDGAA